MTSVLPTSPSGPTSDKYQRIAADLAEHGWAVHEDFLSGNLVASLRDEVVRRYQEGALRRAAIGRGENT